MVGTRLPPSGSDVTMTVFTPATLPGTPTLAAPARVTVNKASVG